MSSQKKSVKGSLLHRLLTNQEMMMDQLKVIQMTMQKIPGEPAGGPDPLGRDILPLNDVTSLLALEKRVREEADLQNKMITALSVIGGLDVKDCIWRVMKHCFTNSLAKQLNWRGINGKTAFHRLQLKDVITGTVRNNRLTATATDQEVESYIKKWLHLAGDRDGGRRERERNEDELSKKPAFKILMGPVKEVDKSIDKMSRLFPCQGRQKFVNFG
ncbi:uncharacterized protein LOC117545910 [Gymnodraco acuticeps]|uniref:Uncharacterized protein LOC117545910 n=1 Tax=Gymnodraco acuticeps TaxID=8218 RepID=A0A6P8U4W3_GYMAC|nr:uncharacterized protein LOC117545910 [Gymnodraco acuticeps]XP_034071832.1 uncharacterized protein LOC117545910 [Gymnodraco acuticeps]